METAGTRKTMQPADLADVSSVGDPRVSPDGRTVAVVVSTVDLATNSYRSRIWMVPVDGSGRPRPFSGGGASRDSRPRWAPDGSMLAFVSHRIERGSQIVTLPVGSGGEAVTVVEWPEEVEALEWSPDGKFLAFIARAADPSTYGPAITTDKDRPPRRVSRFTSRLDNVGWTMDRPSRVFVVAADGETSPVPLDGPNPDGSDVAGMCWSPDSRRVAWCQGVSEDWDLELRSPLVVAATDGRDDPITIAAASTLSRPCWSPDGATIAVVTDDRFDPPRNGQIAVVALGASESDPLAEPDVLTHRLDRHCASSLAGARSPQWAEGHLWFQVDDRGSVHLYRVASDGASAPEAMVTGEIVVSGFDVAESTVAYTAISPESPGELFVLVDGASRRVTSFNCDVAERIGVAAPERFEVALADGEVVDAWYLAPTGTPRGATLLNIHGGPFAQYSGSFAEEFAIQAGAGFGVLWCNPRGSSGRSEAWGRAVRGPKCDHDAGSGWGGVDASDVLAALDAGIERFSLDPRRIGVLGGSYGGYLTSWLVGHTDRFSAACSERAVNNQLAMVWTSDIGTTFQRGYVGVSHLDDPGEYLRMSPVTYARAINTPLLILHSEADLRCPISQAEELWVALRSLGRVVEFVRFPGSSHELSRSGPPRQRVARQQLILEFFDRYLPMPVGRSSGS
ncbi:MAG: S9 family peptidase [Acidimicrobiales bacterium]